MVFLTDFSGSYAIQYNRAANFTARTTKKIPKLQKKFSEVPAKISRCSMKSFGLCHEIISPVILKSFGLSQDLPLSQNGQNFRREKLGNRGKRIDEPNGATGPTGANRKWARLRGAIWLIGPSWLIWLIRPSSPNWPDLYFTAFLPRWMYILPVLKILVFSGEGILSIFLLSL